MPTRLRFIFSGPENGGRAVCGVMAIRALESYWRAWKAYHFVQNLGRHPSVIVPVPGHKTQLEHALWLWNNLPPNYKQAAHFTVVRERRNQNWLRSPAHPGNLGLLTSFKVKPHKWKLEAADLEYHPSAGIAAALGQHKPAPKQRKRPSYGNVPVATQAGESAPTKPAKPSLRIGVWS